MGPQCTTWLLMIYSMTSLSPGYAASSEPPIIIFDPIMKGHQKYNQRIKSPNNDQQPTNNHIFSSVNTLLGRVQRKNKDVEEHDDEYFIEYEPKKINAIDLNEIANNRNKTEIKENKRIGSKLVDIVSNSFIKNNDSQIQRIHVNFQENLNHKKKINLNNKSFDPDEGNNGNNFVKNNVNDLHEKLITNSSEKIIPHRDASSYDRKRNSYKKKIASGGKKFGRVEGNMNTPHNIDGNSNNSINSNTHFNRTSRKSTKLPNSWKKFEVDSAVESNKVKQVRKTLKNVSDDRSLDNIKDERGTLKFRNSDKIKEVKEYGKQREERGTDNDAIERTKVNKFIDNENPMRQSHPIDSEYGHTIVLKPRIIGPNHHQKLRRENDKFVKRLDDNVEEMAESNKEEHHEPKMHSEKLEEGGDEEHHEDYHEADGEEGKEDYESHHKHEKNEKGHHDKESHDKEYDEKKGNEKKHSDDSEYHEHYESGEKREKNGEFEEEGKFSKGHSTKGDHVVHKKDEYEKLVEFYDESHEEDGNEKDGEFYHEFDEMHGGSEKSGHGEKYGEIEKHGKKSQYENGHHHDEKKGHDSKNGHEKYHDEEKEYGEEGGQEKGKKWLYKQ